MVHLADFMIASIRLVAGLSRSLCAKRISDLTIFGVERVYTTAPALEQASKATIVGHIGLLKSTPVSGIRARSRASSRRAALLVLSDMCACMDLTATAAIG